MKRIALIILSVATIIAGSVSCQKENLQEDSTSEGSASVGTAKATIGGREVDVNWVQLWENGPKFAEYNVGASSAPEKGTRMTFTDATKQGSDYAWGANWCTPSKEQMEELLKSATTSRQKKVKCTYTREGGQYGFKFEGIETGYTGNSVFFPAQNGNSDGFAYYWSSTADGSKAWCMYLLYTGRWLSDWSSYTRDYNYLVRPVLKN